MPASRDEILVMLRAELARPRIANSEKYAAQFLQTMLTARLAHEDSDQFAAAALNLLLKATERLMRRVLILGLEGTDPVTGTTARTATVEVSATPTPTE